MISKMFRPLEMRRIRVLVLDHYLDRVINALGRLRSVQITKIKEEDIRSISNERISEKYSELLDRIHNLIDILKIQDKEVKKVSIDEKSSEEYFNDIEKGITEIENEVIPLVEELARISEEKKILEHDELSLKCLDKLGVDVKWLGKSDFLYTVAGFLDLDKIEELESSVSEQTKENFLILKRPSQDKFSVVIITLKEYQNDIDGILKGLNFDFLETKDKNLNGVRDRLKLIKETEDRLERDLNKIRDGRFKDILVAREITQIEKNTQNIMLNLGKTDRIYAIEGWIPARDIDEMVGEIENVSKGCVVVHIYKPRPDDKVPVSFHNPKIFKPFEIIVEMFGLPSYNEIDPTPIIGITFPLIFGLMFGDVGHGLLLALAGLGIIYLKRGNESYWNLGMILLYCGISAVLFGFLYGSIFGNEEVLPTIWIKPSHDIMNMFGIAIFVGVVHICIGLIANAVNKVHEIGLSSIVHSLSRLWFFCGVVTIIALIFPFPIPFFMDIQKMYPFTDILLYGIFIPIVLMLIGDLIHEFHPFSVRKLLGLLGDGLFEIFETFSMFLSNTISYSRIAILAVIHAMMMMAVNEISYIEAISNILLLSILILVVGNILVLVLEGFIVFIHTIRLHFYEWFIKFYGATGVKYTPLSIERKYTKLSY